MINFDKCGYGYMRVNMGLDKNKIIILVVAILFAVLIISAKISERRKMQEEENRAREINEELEKDTVRTKEEILERLEQAIIANEQDNVYMRVSGKYTEDELFDIRKEIDPMLGKVTGMTYTTSSEKNVYEDGTEGEEIKDYFVGVNYSYEKTDEYYVLEAILEGKDIPKDRNKAKKMQEVCESFLKDNIKSGMSEYDKELAVHDYIVGNAAYTFSNGKEKTEFEAYGILVNHKGVCEGYAKATALLLRCCGIDAKLVSGKADNGSSGNVQEGDTVILTADGKVIDGHMWNQVKIDGLWYNLDATWDDPVGGEPVIDHTYFNVSDMILKKNHTWDEKSAEKCSSTMSNYYDKNNLYFKSDSSFKDYLKNELANGRRDTIECAVTQADLSESAMYFVFDYDGINSYQIREQGVDGYKILYITFN